MSKRVRGLVAAIIFAIAGVVSNNEQVANAYGYVQIVPARYYWGFGYYCPPSNGPAILVWQGYGTWNGQTGYWCEYMSVY